MVSAAYIMLYHTAKENWRPTKWHTHFIPEFEVRKYHGVSYYVDRMLPTSRDGHIAWLEKLNSKRLIVKEKLVKVPFGGSVA